MDAAGWSADSWEDARVHGDCDEGRCRWQHREPAVLFAVPEPASPFHCGCVSCCLLHALVLMHVHLQCVLTFLASSPYILPCCSSVPTRQSNAAMRSCGLRFAASHGRATDGTYLLQGLRLVGECHFPYVIQRQRDVHVVLTQRVLQQVMLSIATEFVASKVSWASADASGVAGLTAASAANTPGMPPGVHTLTVPASILPSNRPR